MHPSTTDAAVARLRVGGRIVAELRDGAEVTARLSPRPYLHPVRTLGGTEVSELMPADHAHHLGVGVAVADLGGVSFWGGRTYTPDRGSVMLDNHGRQRLAESAAPDPGSCLADLEWTAPDGRRLAAERRALTATGIDSDAWALTLRTTLRNATGSPLRIASPAANGRPGAGYGGCFWRAPITAGRPADCVGPGDRGEADLNGSRAAWLALRGGTDAAGWSLVFLQPGAHRDPWFVRADHYPGVGAALAFAEARTLGPGDAAVQAVTTVVVDGRRTARECAELAELGGRAAVV